VKTLAKKGLIDQEMAIYLRWESLSQTYGWSPAQIKEMDPEDLDAYTAILDGRNAASRQQNKKSGSGGINPQMPLTQQAQRMIR